MWPSTDKFLAILERNLSRVDCQHRRDWRASILAGHTPHLAGLKLSSQARMDGCHGLEGLGKLAPLLFIFLS